MVGTHHVGTEAPGLAAPPAADPKNKAPGVAAEGFEGNTELNERESATADAQRKRLATVRARLALIGHQLIETPSGVFIVSRWNLSRELPHLPAVESFAELVGASR